jgi:hypothetical protein
MKFIIQGPIRDNIYNLMRRIGYHLLGNNEGTKESNFVRNLGRDFYPRFHIYLKEEGNDLLINLHLDQKRPSYKGVSAHSGEYDGELVEKEAERIKQEIR